MTAESALKVISDTDETKGEIQRTPDGRFAQGTCGGLGGSRPGSGRKPEPVDETLLKRLYDLLDSTADRALQVLIDQLEHADPKIAQKAAAIVLSKTLPEARFLKSWKDEEAKEADWRNLKQFGEFLAYKRDRAVQEAEAEGGEVGVEESTSKDRGHSED